MAKLVIAIVFSLYMSSTYQLLVKLFCGLRVITNKSLNYHWHVTGADFYQYHLLLQRVYETLDGFTDRLAEHIRGMGRVPGAFAIYIQLSSVQEDTTVPAAATMLFNLLADVKTLKADLAAAAESAANQGTLNLLGDIDESFDTLTYLLGSSQSNFNV